MHKVSSRTALLIIAVAAVISACGQQHAGSPSSGSAGDSGSVPSGSVPAVTGGCLGRAAVASGRTVTVGVGDNGKSFCVRPGTGIRVILRGTPVRKWRPIRASPGVLVPRPDGRLLLQLGVTGEFFVAAHPGTAVISSARPLCASHASSGPGSASPGGTMSCDSELAFHATINVRS